MWIVYKTTNKINDMFYIGIHKTFNDDFDGYFGSSDALNRSIETHGKENFIRETLSKHSSREEASRREFETIHEYIILGYWNSMFNVSLSGIFWGYTVDDLGWIRPLSKTLRPKTSKLLGVKNISQLEYVKQKKIDSNRNRRGVDHSFQSKDVIAKIQRTNLIKYGCVGNQKGKIHIRKVDEPSIATMIYKYNPIPEGWEKGSKVKK